MKTKLFLIAAILVLASMFTLMSCNNDSAGDVVDPNVQTQAADDKYPLSKYDVDGAKLSTSESREKLEEAYKELQTLYNLAADTVAKTEGDVKESVKALGTEITSLLDKIANTEYATYEEFIKDATTAINQMKKDLVTLVPSIA